MGSTSNVIQNVRAPCEPQGCFISESALGKAQDRECVEHSRLDHGNLQEQGE